MRNFETQCHDFGRCNCYQPCDKPKTVDKPKQEVYTIKGGQSLEQWKESVQFVCGVLRHEGWIELNKLLDKLQKV